MSLVNQRELHADTRSFDNALRAALREDPDVILVGEMRDLETIRLALSAAENLMTANPDMTALYATGEPALLGAVSAVTSQARTDSIKVFGWDLTKSAIEGIDQGWVTAVIQQDPAGVGKAAIEAFVKLKKGETVEPIINVPVTIVTKENVDKFRDMFK